MWGVIKKSVNSDLNTPLNVTLGNKSDSASSDLSSSLFSWVKNLQNYIYNIWHHLETHLSTGRMAQIDNINSNVAAMKGSNVLNYGIVKSVQRGTAKASNGIGQGLRVYIGTVDTSKSVVLLNGAWAYYGGEFLPPYVETLQSNYFDVYCVGANGMGGSSASTFSWQVIEFY